MQASVRLAQRGFDLFRRLAARKNKAEITLPFGKGNQRVVQPRGYHNIFNQRDGFGFFHAAVPAENARAWDGNHHHAGSPRRLFERGKGKPRRVAQDNLFQADVHPELQNAGTEPPDGAPRGFDEPNALVVDA